MPIIRVQLRSGENHLTPNLNNWRINGYRVVSVIFDHVFDDDESKLVYIHASGLHAPGGLSIRSSLTPNLDRNIIEYLPKEKDTNVWLAGEASTFFNTDTVLTGPLTLYCSTDGHTTHKLGFTMLIDLELDRLKSI